MISSILIPTDFSQASWKATQLGLELSRTNENIRLSILHIFPSTSNEEARKSSQIQLEKVKDRMNKLTKELTDQHDSINNLVMSGNIEEVLIKFIKEGDFDLVIVGVNSNGINNEIGSHTMSMIEKSEIPVMVVPNDTSSYGAIAS